MKNLIKPILAMFAMFLIGLTRAVLVPATTGFAMTALSADRQAFESKERRLASYPVATATTLYKGALVCLNSSGYAIPAADTAGISGVVGVADEQVVNSGADGAKKVRIRSGRSFKFTATSITQAMLGAVMYVEDDQTFDDAAGVTNMIPAGILADYVSSTSGWIFIPEGGMSVDQPNLTVATADIIDDAVTAAKIADGAIDAAAKLAADVVTTAKILDANVTNAKLAAGGPGFVTGEGGAVTQLTDSGTGVTLNKRVGQITTVALTTAAAAEEAFIVTNSEVDANDIVVVTTTYAGGGTPIVFVTTVAAGAFTINITNVHASAALDAVVVINFAVIKGVAA